MLQHNLLTPLRPLLGPFSLLIDQQPSYILLMPCGGAMSAQGENVSGMFFSVRETEGGRRGGE